MFLQLYPEARGLRRGIQRAFRTRFRARRPDLGHSDVRPLPGVEKFADHGVVSADAAAEGEGSEGWQEEGTIRGRIGRRGHCPFGNR